MNLIKTLSVLIVEHRNGLKRHLVCAVLMEKVKLAALQSPPEPLNSLMAGNSTQANAFLRNIRQYNSCFQMTSFGATEVTNYTGFMPTFTVQAIQALGNIDWSQPPDKVVQSVNNILRKCVHTFPLKNSQKSSRKAWFTHHLRSLRSNCLHLRHLSNLDPSFTRDYCVARTAFIHYAKAAYLHKKSEMLIIMKNLALKLSIEIYEFERLPLQFPFIPCLNIWKCGFHVVQAGYRESRVVCRANIEKTIQLQWERNLCVRASYNRRMQSIAEEVLCHDFIDNES
ncbi:hypothetical protein GQR58_022068 [Nymphon striatum]|nr:hypothetical protein GQR58_022068 [Nymphon striatum]